MDKGHNMRSFGRTFRDGLGSTLTGLGMLSALSVGAGATHAAEGPQAGVPELEEVVVAARRREESLQDTPDAVTVVTSALLGRVENSGTTDMDKIAPNLQVHTDGTAPGNNTAA